MRAIARCALLTLSRASALVAYLSDTRSEAYETSSPQIPTLPLERSLVRPCCSEVSSGAVAVMVVPWLWHRQSRWWCMGVDLGCALKLPVCAIAIVPVIFACGGDGEYGL